MEYRLSNKQKWQLAATLLLIYYPVLFYVDVPVYLNAGIAPLSVFYHEATTVVIIFLEFFIWIAVSEWILNILFEKFGEEFMLRFQVPAQLTALLIATVMGLAFVFASGRVFGAIDRLAMTIFNTHLFVSFPLSYATEFFELYKRANIAFILILMLSAFYLIGNRRAHLRMKEGQLRTERLEKEATLAQLAALRNQVNPHFLFNSLSILTSLVQGNSSLSVDFINQLSKFYRYTLEKVKDEEVMLQVEIDFIQSYLFLMKIRFGDKLNVIIILTENDRIHYNIAPLTLQLLLENAVKHNRMSKEDPLTIKISIKEYYLVIQNNLQLREDPVLSTHTGLQNILDRYRLLTSLPVVIEESAESFTVKIPLLSSTMK
jgi:two-component system LytT family sensor kinase